MPNVIPPARVKGMGPKARLATAVECAATWPSTSPQGNYTWWLRYWSAAPATFAAPAFGGTVEVPRPLDQLPMFADQED